MYQNCHLPLPLATLDFMFLYIKHQTISQKSRKITQKSQKFHQKIKIFSKKSRKNLEKVFFFFFQKKLTALAHPHWRHDRLHANERHPSPVALDDSGPVPSCADGADAAIGGGFGA
jgi:hypothetical protein